MALAHTAATRNAIANLVVDQLDAGAGAGKLQLTKVVGSYTAGNILAEITLADPAFGAAAAGKASASGLPKTDSSANNSGTAIEFRVVDSNDLETFRGTVTATGGGGDLEMLDPDITAGEPVDLTQLDYTAPV